MPDAKPILLVLRNSDNPWFKSSIFDSSKDISHMLKTILYNLFIKHDLLKIEVGLRGIHAIDLSMNPQIRQIAAMHHHCETDIFAIRYELNPADLYRALEVRLFLEDGPAGVDPHMLARSVYLVRQISTYSRDGSGP